LRDDEKTRSIVIRVAPHDKFRFKRMVHLQDAEREEDGESDKVTQQSLAEEAVMSMVTDWERENNLIEE